MKETRKVDSLPISHAYSPAGLRFPRVFNRDIKIVMLSFPENKKSNDNLILQRLAQPTYVHKIFKYGSISARRLFPERSVLFRENLSWSWSYLMPLTR